MQFVIDGIDEIRSKATVLLQLSQLYKSYMPRSSNEWSQPSTRLRNLLIAHDARANGASYREVAIAVFGEKRVKEQFDLPDRTLKNQAVRLVKRAHEMVGGRYRELLE